MMAMTGAMMITQMTMIHIPTAMVQMIIPTEPQMVIQTRTANNEK